MENALDYSKPTRGKRKGGEVVCMTNLD